MPEFDNMLSDGKMTNTLSINEPDCYVESWLLRESESVAGGGNRYIWLFGSNILPPSINKSYMPQGRGGLKGHFCCSNQAKSYKDWAGYMLNFAKSGVYGLPETLYEEPGLSVFKIFIYPGINFDVDNRIKILHDTLSPMIYKDDNLIEIGGEMKIISGRFSDTGVVVITAPDYYAKEIFDICKDVKAQYRKLDKAAKRKLARKKIVPEPSVCHIISDVKDRLSEMYRKREYGIVGCDKSSHGMNFDDIQHEAGIVNFV